MGNWNSKEDDFNEFKSKFSTKKQRRHLFLALRHIAWKREKLAEEKAKELENKEKLKQLQLQQDLERWGSFAEVMREQVDSLPPDLFDRKYYYRLRYEKWLRQQHKVENDGMPFDPLSYMHLYGNPKPRELCYNEEAVIKDDHYWSHKWNLEFYYKQMQPQHLHQQFLTRKTLKKFVQDRGKFLGYIGFCIKTEGTTFFEDTYFPRAVLAMERIRLRESPAPLSFGFFNITTHDPTSVHLERFNSLKHTRYSNVNLDPDELFTAWGAVKWYLETRDLRPYILGDDAGELDHLPKDNPNAVVIGFPTEKFDFENLNKIFRLIKLAHPNKIELIAVGEEMLYRTGNDNYIGITPYVRALEEVTGLKAVVPARTIEFMHHVLISSNIPDANKAVMISDEVSDIILGLQAGMLCALVRCGKYRHGDELTEFTLPGETVPVPVKDRVLFVRTFVDAVELLGIYYDDMSWLGRFDNYAVVNLGFSFWDWQGGMLLGKKADQWIRAARESNDPSGYFTEVGRGGEPEPEDPQPIRKTPIVGLLRLVGDVRKKHFRREAVINENKMPLARWGEPIKQYAFEFNEEIPYWRRSEPEWVTIVKVDENDEPVSEPEKRLIYWDKFPNELEPAAYDEDEEPDKFFIVA